MRRSWLGLQLVLLSCALLLAVVAVEGRHGKEEESSSEEECHCEKRHCCVVECCEERHHHEDEEGCKKRHHHEDEECCKKRHHHEDEECCKKRHHHEDEECCKKRHCHEDEECRKKKHSHGKEGARKKPSRKRHPFLEDSEEATEDSSEIYKRFLKQEQEMIRDLAAQTSEAVPHYRKEQAVAHFNQGSEETYYKNIEDGQLEYKKAIGVMIYVKMLLGETNCTKTREQEEAGVEYSRAFLEKEGCQFLPQLKQEKQNCTFGIFLDMRTEKKAVVSQDCTIIPRIKEFSKPLKGLRD